MNDSFSKEAFRQLMFHTGILVMACDGEVHPHEIDALRLAHKQTNYFGGIDFEVELARFVSEVENDTRGAIQGYFEALREAELDPVQQLQLVELTLRIVYADQCVHENEKRFCQMLLRILTIPGPVLEQRFGELPFIAGSSQEKRVADADLVSALANELSISEIDNIRVIDN